MSTDAVTAPRTSTAQLFARLCWVLSGLVAIKYVALAIEGGVANAPHFFLICFALPLAIAALLSSRRPRIAAVVALPFAAWFALWVVLILVTSTLEPYWGDYMVVFIGGPISFLIIGTAVRMLFRR
jgi:hypothetical protein